MTSRLIAISSPCIEECKTAQDLIVYCARVSNPANQEKTETGAKLIKYLLNHKHWSPLEMISLTIEINTTRDISRQILRHRSFSFQEFSTRYALIENNPIFKETRLQDTKNRQNSLETDDKALKTWFNEWQKDIWYRAYYIYENAVNSGIAKEQARSLLPEGLTPTKLYMAGTLRSWYHYCKLRMAHGTQKEHADIAKDCWEIVCSQIPILRDIND